MCIRDSDYGGSLENRIRLHCQIIEAIRSQVGAEYPLALRLGACEGLENGSTLADAISACAAFEKAGVDLIDITGGLGGYVRPGHSEQGYFQDYSCLLYTSRCVSETAAADKRRADRGNGGPFLFHLR